MIKVLDFHCLKCSYIFEVWEDTKKFNSFNIHNCPRCGSESRQNEIQLTNKTKHSSWEVK